MYDYTEAVIDEEPDSTPDWNVSHAAEPTLGGTKNPMLFKISRSKQSPVSFKIVQNATENSAYNTNQMTAMAAPATPPSFGPRKAKYIDVFAISSRVGGQRSRYNEDVAVRNIHPPAAHYLDVLAFKSPSLQLERSYNEDIAERNLDLRQLAHNGSAPMYDPNSKYQEEVAIRNSMDIQRPSARDLNHGFERVNSNIRAPEPSLLPYRHQPSKLPNGLAQQEVVSPGYPAPHHMYSMNAKHAAPNLPNTVREGVVDISARETPPKVPPKHPRRVASQDRPLGSSDIVPTRNNHLEVPALNVHRSRPRSPGVQGQTANGRPGLNPFMREYSGASIATQQSFHSIPDYQLSNTELSQITPYSERDHSQHRSPITNGYIGAPEPLYGRRPTPLRVPSHFSSLTALKKAVNLPNRTIMDLTGEDDDIFSDRDSAEYTETPVLGQAHRNALQSAHASMVMWGNQYPRSPGIPHPPKPNAHEQPNNGLGTYDRLNDYFPTHDRVTKPQLISRPSTFSEINTVMSMSPRPSVVADNFPDPTNSTRHDSMTGLASDLGVLPDSTGVSSPDNQQVAPAGTKREETSTTQLPPQQVTYPQVSHPRSDEMAPLGDSPAVLTRDFAPIPILSPARNQNILGRTNTAERVPVKKTVGFVGTNDQKAEVGPNPSRATRAVPPVQANSSRSRESTFDEEDFLRKQIQARAALQRLQKSLEDGLHASYNAAAADAAAKQQAHAKTLHQASANGGVASPIVQSQPSALAKHGQEHTSQSTARSLAQSPTVRPAVRQQVSSSNTGANKPGFEEPRLSMDSEWEDVDEHDVSGSTAQSLTPVRADFEHQVDDSPGEVSLSSFPLPWGSPRHSRPQSEDIRPPPISRESQKSMSSITSAFSIPYHLIPGRTSSMGNYLSTTF